MTSEKFRAGNKSLTTTLVYLQNDPTPLGDGVMLRAHPNNVPDIHVKPTAQGGGYILEPGEEVLIRIKTLDRIRVQASGAGVCIISWVAL